MKKIVLILALAIGLGFVSPTETSAKNRVEVTSIEHCDGYDFVEFNDGSMGIFYDDGSYEIYIRKQG
jgi:hypothetical protein